MYNNGLAVTVINVVFLPVF